MVIELEKIMHYFVRMVEVKTCISLQHIVKNLPLVKRENFWNDGYHVDTTRVLITADCGFHGFPHNAVSENVSAATFTTAHRSKPRRQNCTCCFECPLHQSLAFVVG